MTREEGIKILESLKTVLPAAKDEINEIIELINTPLIITRNIRENRHELERIQRLVKDSVALDCNTRRQY